MPAIPLEPNIKYALRGRIATLNAQSEVIDDGIVYIEGDTIQHVQPSNASAPDGWSKSKAFNVSGTIFPGMIELHNHLAYNIIPMWDVPKTFDNRDQWRRHSDYRKKMTGPLEVLGHIDGYLQAIVRYTECKLLFSGVTSSQGITLASHGGIRTMYKGMVRNVEQTLDPDLPAGKTKIADIKEASKLQEQLDKGKTYLLHLAEGTQESANKHFQALRFPNSSQWAINENLAGIHAVGLFKEDLKVMAEHDGRVIWSPMSNLLLYGVSLDIETAKDEGILLSIGSDWSPSGSKNLLNEIKVAKEVSDRKGGVFTNEEIVRMVTTNPAKIMQWEEHCGSIEPGKKADIFVIKGKEQDVYEQFIACREKSINWVIIDGIPRFGINRLMNKFTGAKERITLNRLKRSLYLAVVDDDNPIELNVNYKNARTKLKQGLKKLPSLAAQVHNASSELAFGASGTGGGGFTPNAAWIIADDHSDHGDHCGRHHIRLEGEPTTVEDGFDHGAAPPLKDIILPSNLDVSNVEEDKFYFKRLAQQMNLPEYLKIELPKYYGQQINLDDAQEYKLQINKEEAAAFDQVQSLSGFLKTRGYLSLSEKMLVLDQAETVLREAYVHRIQKNALYATNPIEKLRVLRNEIQQTDSCESEIEFHRRVIEIFNSLRDLHTLYQLPEPFSAKVAFLPFLVEKFYDGEEVKYLASRIIGKNPSPNFKKGVEITHWNGVAMERAVLINGRRYAGSNDAARLARGLNTMTFRPMSVMLPPEEEWVNISYRQLGTKRLLTQRFNWRIGSYYTVKRTFDIDNAQTDKFRLKSGYDYMSQVTQEIKKGFFAKKIKPKAKRPLAAGLVLPGKDYLPTELPGIFKAKLMNGQSSKIGYVRIYTFTTSDPHGYAREFIRLINSFETNKLVLDIRNNPGGNILAAEFILQALSKKTVTPQAAQFINSKLTRTLCADYSDPQNFPGLDLSKWNKTLRSMKNTGAHYSLAYAITPEDDIKKYKSKKNYEVVLITDALCYSASDIFASGFQDHGIGKILGIDENTGAGGANVWSHSLLNQLTKGTNTESKTFERLPYGADFRVAIRRTLRSGENAGLPLEDLGLQPDLIHKMTKNDLLNKNIDLLATASGMFE